MDEQGSSEVLHSYREVDSFSLQILVSKSRVKVKGILDDHNLSEQKFIDRFPDLAKVVQDLPDETSPSG